MPGPKAWPTAKGELKPASCAVRSNAVVRSAMVGLGGRRGSRSRRPKIEREYERNKERKASERARLAEHHSRAKRRHRDGVRKEPKSDRRFAGRHCPRGGPNRDFVNTHRRAESEKIQLTLESPSCNSRTSG